MDACPPAPSLSLATKQLPVFSPHSVVSSSVHQSSYSMTSKTWAFSACTEPLPRTSHLLYLQMTMCLRLRVACSRYPPPTPPAPWHGPSFCSSGSTHPQPHYSIVIASLTACLPLLPLTESQSLFAIENLSQPASSCTLTPPSVGLADTLEAMVCSVS